MNKAANRSQFNKSGLIFYAILVLQAVLAAYAVLQHRVVRGHDGFQYFSLQYYFLNNAVNTGTVAQWIPFLTHGTVSTWWYVVQAGLFQNVLLNIAPLLKGINFLPLFHLGFFADEIILATGTWLLSGRYFKSAYTRAYLLATVLGSAVWLDQPWYNFHFYYAIPLALHMLHRFLETSRWMYAALGANLIALQAFGNLPYLLPVVTLVIFLYLLGYGVFNRGKIIDCVKGLKWNWGALGAVVTMGLSFAAFYLSLRIGVDEIANYNTGRQMDASTTLEHFLSYAANQGLDKWVEIILGVAPSVDYTLYIGIAAVPLALLGFYDCVTARRHLHIPILVVLLMLFSLGTFVARFFYHVWPMMVYFRHLALISPVIKFFICILSAIGFEALLEHAEMPADRALGPKRFFSPYVGFLALSTLTISGFLVYLARDFDTAAHFVKSLVATTETQESGLFFFKDLTADNGILSAWIAQTAACAFVAGTALLVYLYLPARKRMAVLALLIGLQMFDLFVYRAFHYEHKTIPMDARAYKILEFQEMPYSKRRVHTKTSRMLNKGQYLDDAALIKHPRIPAVSDLYTEFGAQYWSLYAFLFLDDVGSSFRTDHWLFALDRYMRAYWGQPLNDLSIRPAGAHLNIMKMVFPERHPAATKIAGRDKDKIQFFRNAYAVSSHDEIAALITDKKYAGDMLFVSSAPGEETPLWQGQSSLSTDERMAVEYEVSGFSADEMTVLTDIPGDQDAWMLYSDTWHPTWKAEINGRQAPIHQGNLAYKAVRLRPGANRVRFYFEDPRMTWLTRLVGLNSLLWLILTAFLAFRIVIGAPKGADHGLKGSS